MALSSPTYYACRPAHTSRPGRGWPTSPTPPWLRPIPASAYIILIPVREPNTFVHGFRPPQLCFNEWQQHELPSKEAPEYEHPKHQCHLCWIDHFGASYPRRLLYRHGPDKKALLESRSRQKHFANHRWNKQRLPEPVWIDWEHLHYCHCLTSLMDHFK